MREIKFRAWLSGIKKMTYSHTLEELMNWDTKKEDNGTATWLQYTGLKDKHGNEIYEGDIIKSVIYETIGEKYVIDDIMRFHYDAVDLLLHEDDLEVIGNIYENPELIEVTT